jgi:2-octaprenyl-6-methoxyphenol hydroxylase
MSRTAAVDALNRTLLSDFLPASALRGLGLFLVDRVPPLRRFAMRQGLAAV